MGLLSGGCPARAGSACAKGFPPVFRIFPRVEYSLELGVFRAQLLCQSVNFQQIKHG